MAEPDERGPKGDRQFITALARGFEVLRCFSAAQPSLSATELSRMIGLPQPTVWRLCHTLQKIGMLRQNPENGRYSVSVGVLGLGIASLQNVSLDAAARQEMRAIANTYGIAVSLCVPERHSLLVMAREQGNGSLVLNMSVGSRYEMAHSTAGAAYLSQLPEIERREAFDTLAHEEGEDWPQRREMLLGMISECQHHGFLCSPGLLHQQIGSCAAPIRHPEPSQSAVLTAGGPVRVIREDLLRDEIGPRLLTLAQSLERAGPVAGFFHSSFLNAMGAGHDL